MQKVSIALTPAEWQTVANALSARPFAEVEELIGSIRQQYEAAVAPPVALPVAEAPPKADADAPV